MNSPPLSLYGMSFPPVSKEQLNMFHSIDRELFSRLLTKLGRDPSESMQVMGFLLWLEKECKNSSLVKTLLTLPLNLLKEVVNESVSCLKCIESDIFIQSSTQLAFLPKLLEKTLTLKYFHENRISVLRGVTMKVNDVCVRAFEDIIQSHFVRNVNSPTLGGPSDTPRNLNLSVTRSNGTGVYVSPFLTIPLNQSNVVGGLNPRQNMSFEQSLVPNYFGCSSNPLMVVENVQAYDATRALQSQTVSNDDDDLSEIFGRQMRIEEDKDVEPDDRTIFLTFSKGYPISENEVREFFTRKYGDFIEEIHMQEVPSDEQPLYARLISKSVSIMYVIIGEGRAKYSINGKHIWARKYTNIQRTQI